MRIKRKRKINFVTVMIIFMISLLLVATFVYYNYNRNQYNKSNLSNTVVLAKETELRTGPDSSYPVFKSLQSGVTLEKKAESNDWIEVKTDDEYIGWIAGWYIVGSNIKSPEERLKEQLKKYTVIINPIHIDGFDDVNLKISSEIKNKLEALGINVIITRNNDKNIAAAEVNQLAIEKKAILILEINSNNNLANSNGPAIYYPNSSSKVLAKYIEKSLSNNFILRTKTSEKNENLSKDSNDNIPKVLVITGNLASQVDKNILSDSIYLDQYSLSLKTGIEEYLYYLLNIDNYNEKRKEQLTNMPKKGMNIPFYYTKQDEFKNIDYGLENNKKISDNGDMIISLYMILEYLDSESNTSVLNIVDWASNKYYAKGGGTSINILQPFADKNNIKIENINNKEIDKLNEALKNNKPVLVQFSSGLFGNKVTYKVIRGYEDNKYYLNDPDDDDLKLNNYTGFTKNDIERNMSQAWIFSK